MSNKLTGIVRIRVNNELLRSKPGAEIDIGGPARTTHAGSAVHGFTEELKPSKVTCTVVHDALTDLLKMRAWSNVTLEFECDTGVTYQIVGAWMLNTPTLKSGDGVALEFEGPPADQI